MEVPGLDLEQLEKEKPGECSADIRRRVEYARQKQRERYKTIKVTTNAQLRSRHFEKYCPLNREAKQLLHQSFKSLNLSMRAHDRIIKVARTIADLDNCEIIDAKHIAEAVQYRNLDREG